MADTGPVLALQNVYLKDCSYEAPNGPRVDGNWNPQINLDLQTSANVLGARAARGGADRHRVGQADEVTIFLVEVKQAGLFVMRNLPEEDMKRAISTVCPGVLFPYARCGGLAARDARAASRSSCCRRSTSTRCTPRNQQTTPPTTN